MAKTARNWLVHTAVRKLKEWAPEVFMCEGCESLDVGTILWQGPGAYSEARDSRPSKPIDTSQHCGLASLHHLRESCASCECCCIIYNSLLSVITERVHPQHHEPLKTVPISIKLAQSGETEAHLEIAVEKGTVKAVAFLQLHHSGLLQLPWYEYDQLTAEDVEVSCPVRDPKSDDALGQLRDWLKACDTHSGCRPAYRNPPDLPRRLLFVGTLQKPELRLAESFDVPPDYIALSYCWGDLGQYTLVSCRLRLFQDCIDENHVSATARDTLFLARQLGICFVWIDALCIVQDDAEDWNTEASKMGRIYYNAWLTVCAANTTAAVNGFLHKRTPLVACCGKIKKKGQATRRIYLAQREGCLLEGILAHEPLMQRGWCLQERLLSRRKVYYCHHRMIWQCDETAKQDTGRHIACYPEENYWLGPSSWRVNKRASEPGFNVESLWDNIITDYSKTSLTRVTDKLAAVAGLAKEFQATYAITYYGEDVPPGIIEENAYLAGLWLLSMPEALLWYPSPRRREQEYQVLEAPSWSWASVHCRIQYERRKGFGTLASLTDYHAEAMATSPFAAVQECWLFISAPLVEVSLAEARKIPTRTVDCFCNSANIQSLFAPSHQQFSQADLDLPEPPIQLLIDPHCNEIDGDLGFLIIRRQPSGFRRRACLDGILVLRVADLDHIYQRVGYFKGIPNIDNDSLVWSTVKLV